MEYKTPFNWNRAKKCQSHFISTLLTFVSATFYSNDKRRINCSILRKSCQIEKNSLEDFYKHCPHVWPQNVRLLPRICHYVHSRLRRSTMRPVHTPFMWILTQLVSASDVKRHLVTSSFGGWGGWLDNGEHFFTKDLCLFQISQRSWKLHMVGAV